MKGIIIANNSTSLLHLVTNSISKQLLPIYDKPIIYHSIAVLMLAKIRDILIITDHKNISAFKKLLSNGHHLGINLSYQNQSNTDDIAQIFLINEEFINGERCALILDDSIYYGHNFIKRLQIISRRETGATIFIHQTTECNGFGAVEFDENYKVLSIEKESIKSKLPWIMTGICFYDNCIVEIAREIKSTTRSKVKIDLINQAYLNMSQLNVELLGRGFTWICLETPDNLIEGAQFVHTIENRQGLKIACLEEIAFQNGWLTIEQVIFQAKMISKTLYGQYLLRIVEQNSKIIHSIEAIES
ncbi:sugar phosphate nucleotidyltransferase (plasmid) [Arsenophonus sp. aPb]|uniref:sugar phosphate nucleotidyltransferase n=1 Tax=Arsenophonus sp. aPb TaxID=3041619 RepID=UPI002469802E|nr:sugar phosphate nucleotidyltransferase [Arsenophonus sp. aPb]WGL99915.1 sugar phosphate nucleotidyltransferase [Arsenophonus sp. aPb]